MSRTRDRMQSTAGSLALAGVTPPRDAFLVERLRAAGAVLLGKGEPSEWANFRSTPFVERLSGRGGPMRNPYAWNRTPSGRAPARACASPPISCGGESDRAKIRHSESSPLPSSTAPAARSRSTRNASRGGVTPASASEPAVLCIRSRVATLSFTSTGMPCAARAAFGLALEHRARWPAPARRVASRTARSAGPLRSSSSIRWRYAVTSERAVYFPDWRPACSPAMVASSSFEWRWCRGRWVGPTPRASAGSWDPCRD